MLSTAELSAPLRRKNLTLPLFTLTRLAVPSSCPPTRIKVLTRIGVSVPVHSAERFVIVPGEGISGIAVVLAKPQTVVVTLRLQGEAVIVGTCPTAPPVL